MTLHRTSAARLRTGLAALLGVAVLVSGCRGAADLPLPGGASSDGSQITVSAEFTDVLDLVPRSAVKVDDVTVGEVTDIALDGWTARVTMRVPAGTALPDNARAELRQTSLLGEKFVELSPPTTGATGRLGDGDLIPLARTGRNPEVEEVLAALSMLLNGGGVGQLKVIETELNDAMRGNHEEIRSLVTELSTFVGGLEEQKAEIVRAIENIDTLSARLAARKDDLAAILEETPKGLKILADQRTQLTEMLTALSRLGKVGSRVIEGSREDLLANLASLKPVLGELNRAGDDLPRSLELLLTYPFPDAAQDTIKGDYTNLHITADLDLRDIEVLPVPSLPVPSIPVPSLPVPVPVPSLPLPSLPVPLPTVPLPTAIPTTVPTILPTSTRTGGPLCPPLCAGAGSDGDRSWETLYTGGAS